MDATNVVPSESTNLLDTSMLGTDCREEKDAIFWKSVHVDKLQDGQTLAMFMAACEIRMYVMLCRHLAYV